MLKDGDRLLVPRITQEVTVIGEVQSATSHLYRADLARDDYIAMSGGLTPRADDDRIYVVRADGSVVARSGNAWFSGGSSTSRPATRSSRRSIPSACGRCRSGRVSRSWFISWRWARRRSARSTIRDIADSPAELLTPYGLLPTLRAFSE